MRLFLNLPIALILGFTWTSKMLLKHRFDYCFEKVEKALVKLKLIKNGTIISVPVLRQRLFAYIFPHLVWIFSLYPFLRNAQREALNRKFRVAVRIVHRYSFASTHDLFIVTNENPLETYVQRFIKKRLEKIYKLDLGNSLFLEGIFYLDAFRKKKDSLGHLFRLNRVKRINS